MRKGLTELVFIIDCSGSMAGLESDTIGGFNAMIEKQKKAEGIAYVSTVLFSTDRRVIHDRAGLQKVAPMTDADYQVGGGTALLDAIGKAIHHIANVHKYTCEEDRPEHTLFVITTDGMENASHEYTAAQIKQKNERQKSKYGWEFLFWAQTLMRWRRPGTLASDRIDHRACGCAKLKMSARGSILSKITISPHSLYCEAVILYLVFSPFTRLLASAVFSSLRLSPIHLWRKLKRILLPHSFSACGQAVYIIE